jgi:hypothetical protein
MGGIGVGGRSHLDKIENRFELREDDASEHWMIKDLRAGNVRM